MLLESKGGVGTVWSVDTPGSYIIENVVNHKNAYQGGGNRVVLSSEQIYAINPDVIILPTKMAIIHARNYTKVRFLKILGGA